MAVLRDHISYYEEIFNIEGFLQDPAFLFGFQDCFLAHTLSPSAILLRKFRHTMTRLVRASCKGNSTYHFNSPIPDKMNCPDLIKILSNYGLMNITTLDFFDKRADIIFDMNNPMDDSFRDRFNTVIDIGSTEHVFDTRTCLHNLFKICKVGGHFFMHTPCNGYFKHGFHTFNPELIAQTFEINGFDIQYLKYSTPDGIEIEDANMVYSAILWIVAKKTKSLDNFAVPQQGGWAERYEQMMKSLR